MTALSARLFPQLGNEAVALVHSSIPWGYRTKLSESQEQAQAGMTGLVPAIPLR
jgi:hypothetical protein